MPISYAQVGSVRVLHVKGRLRIGEEHALTEAVRQQLEDGQARIVLNLHDVTTIDSAGLGAVVGAYSMAMGQGRKLVLAELPAKVRDMLMLTHLLPVLEIYDSEAEAIEALR